MKTIVAATAVALLMLPTVRGAHAQAIGELDVRSRLGERFFGAVPVQTGGALLDPQCIRVSRNPNAPAGAEPLEGVRVRIGSSGPVDSVLIETTGNVVSPIVGIRLEIGCENPITRDFLVLGDGVTLPGVPANVAAAPAPVPAAQIPAPAVPTGSATPAPARAATPARRAAPATRRAAPPATPTLAAAANTNIPTPAALGPAAIPTPAVIAPQAPAPVAGIGASAGPDNSRRLAELRARSDDQAASLLALEDRLALLQKQAEMLKAQLEYVLANAASQPASAVTAATSQASANPSAVGPVVVASANGVPTSPSAKTSDASSPLAASAQPRPASPGIVEMLTDWRVAAGGLAALLFGAVVLKMRRRPEKPAAAGKFSPGATQTWSQTLQQPQSATAAKNAHFEHEKTQEFRAPPSITRAEQTVEWRTTPLAGQAERTAEWVPPPTTDTLPVASAKPAPAAAQPTRPGAGISREFHITQQFQPVAERVVALSSPEEIVQQARTHYMEDGDTFHAIDLLEMAVSARKDSNRPWQALFAIYRRENMPERYQRLVLAYRGAFAQDDPSWPAIRTLGRQLDPSNPLYTVDDGAEPIPEDLVERWLGVPLDFTAHLLANEMHDQLMDTFPGRSKKRQRSASE